MKTRLARDDSTLTLEFGDHEELRAFVAQLTEHRAFMVPLDEELALRSTWSVRLAAAGAELALEAEVVQRFDTVSGAFGTAFEVGDWSAERQEAVRALVADPAEAAAPDRAEDTSETLGTSPLLRIKALNPVQRAILAAKAGRVERQILLRDTTPQVLQSLLANPRLEAKEVLRLVKSTHVTAAILQRVAGDGRWGKNQEILTAVARNPKTPSPLAVRLVEQLRTQDLRRMAKMSGGLRENVRRAALREYLRRTQRG